MLSKKKLYALLIASLFGGFRLGKEIDKLREIVKTRGDDGLVG